jgi:hypothetical protein
MLYQGDELIGILRAQTEAVKLFDRGFRWMGTVKPGAALGLVDQYPVGVGNRRIIRELRAEVATAWTGGSKTIRRRPILNSAGEKVTGLQITEHRPVVESR